TLGKIAPRNPGPCDPKHGVDKEAIVGRGPAGIAVFTRQQILDSIPLFVRYLMSSHGSSLNRTATGFTKKPKNALDECQQNLASRVSAGSQGAACCMRQQIPRRGAPWERMEIGGPSGGGNVVAGWLPSL